jgi:processive 1,2-diacylglycerol beta-glucosyltransferase
MRILIATVTAGAGHLQAAAALEEAWRGVQPRDLVQRLDVLEFTPRLYRRMYVEGYVKLVAHAPELWGLVFSKTDNPVLVRKLTRLRRALAKVTATRFTREVRRFKPNAVLCTHYMPLEIVGRLKAKADKRRQAPLFIVSIVTDFEAHALWMEPGVDLYCVAAEETKARLVARGAASGNVAVTGIPVAQKFSGPIEVAAVRKRIGLRDDLPVLLVLSGGFGMGPVTGILAELNKLAQPVQLVVVCGRNEELRRELAVLDRRHPTHVLGFVTNMHELMAVADLVITKPGGLTTSEALAMGKPIFVLNPIPGQEAANSDFLLEHGAAAKANRIEDLPFRLEKLLGSPKLAEMARAAKALGRADAARAVCQEVLARIKV